MYERFKILCEKKGKTMKEVCKDLGISQGTVSNWKKRDSTPSGDLLSKMANYFDVSMEYLLTGKELEPFWDGPSDAPAFTIEELQLLDLFRTLPDAKRSEVIQYCKFLASEARKEKKKDTASSKEA